MAVVTMVYRRPVGAMRLSVEPQLASWDRAAHPSQVKLAELLGHLKAVAGPMLAGASGLWDSRTQPPVLTWPSMRLARIRG